MIIFCCERSEWKCAAFWWPTINVYTVHFSPLKDGEIISPTLIITHHSYRKIVALMESPHIPVLTALNMVGTQHSVTQVNLGLFLNYQGWIFSFHPQILTQSHRPAFVSCLVRGGSEIYAVEHNIITQFVRNLPKAGLMDIILHSYQQPTEQFISHSYCWRNIF